MGELWNDSELKGAPMQGGILRANSNECNMVDGGDQHACSNSMRHVKLGPGSCSKARDFLLATGGLSDIMLDK